MRRELGWMTLCGTLLVSPIGAAANEDANPRQEAIEHLKAELPRAQLLRTESRVSRVFGQPLAHGVEPIDAAERFRTAHSEVFGVIPTDLKPHSLLADARATQPLKLNRETGQYEFTLVYYAQYHNDIPVFRSDLRLLVRNEPGFPVVLAASALHDLGDFSLPTGLRTEMGTEEFVAAKFAVASANALSTSPNLKNFTPPETVIWAGVDGMQVEPRPAIVFIADDAVVPGGVADEKWLYVADAESGAILYREDQILELDVVGNVSGLGTETSGAEQCADEIMMPMPYARVNIGGTVAFTDLNGDFVIPNAGTADVTVESGVRGQYFRVFHQPTNSETELSQVVSPAGPADFLHNATNTEFRRAEVNAYIHANAIRDYVLNYIPDYPVIAGQTEYSITVNEGANSFCPGNAQYQGNNLRFCASSATRPNTAWNSVVYHEYGHHLVSVGGSGQGAYGEGMGDVASMLVLDESGTGYGFFGNGTCDEPLRDADNDCQYQTTGCSSCGSTVHACGRLISGCVWSLRNELLITEPVNYRDILSDLALNSILLHSGSSITPSIAIDYLTLDDNDSDIGNGTPHFQEICAGFGVHNMPCPMLDAVGFNYPAGLPDVVVPNQSATLMVNALAVSDSPVPGTGMISYRVGNAGPFTTVNMTQVSPNQYEAALPAASCPETIEFYVSVEAASAGVVTDPANAPASTFSAVAASGTITEVLYDFELNPGWTVSSTATDGGWDNNPGVPVSGCDRGNPSADFDGSGQCWLTDNSAASACNSDVDNGSTTLTSQVLDLSGLSSPRVSYARWFSNSDGDGPETDRLIVEISSNGGANWSNLETVGPTTTSPNPEVLGGWFVKTYAIPASAQFRIRFIAEDIGAQSVVEAGIDAFEIYDFECDAVSVPGDMNCDGVVSVGDIGAFVLALTDPTGYAVQFPDCDINQGDINMDGFVTVSDIGPFVALLTSM